jgi:GGDEF domain-containing protein
LSPNFKIFEDIAQSIVNTVREQNIELINYPNRLLLSVSIGGVWLIPSPDCHYTGEDLLKEADDMLGEAKKQGKNRAICRRI